MHQIIMILMKNVINLKKDVELQVMDVQIYIHVTMFKQNQYVKKEKNVKMLVVVSII